MDRFKRDRDQHLRCFRVTCVCLLFSGVLHWLWNELWDTRYSGEKENRVKEGFMSKRWRIKITKRYKRRHKWMKGWRMRQQILILSNVETARESETEITIKRFILDYKVKLVVVKRVSILIWIHVSCILSFFEKKFLHWHHRTMKNYDRIMMRIHENMLSSLLAWNLYDCLALWSWCCCWIIKIKERLVWMNLNVAVICGKERKCAIFFLSKSQSLLMKIAVRDERTQSCLHLLFHVPFLFAILYKECNYRPNMRNEYKSASSSFPHWTTTKKTWSQEWSKQKSKSPTRATISNSLYLQSLSERKKEAELLY